MKHKYWIIFRITDTPKFLLTGNKKRIRECLKSEVKKAKVKGYDCNSYCAIAMLDNSNMPIRIRKFKILNVRGVE